MNIHILYNCYWGDGISGGDRRVLDLLKRWTDTEQYHFVLYTTKGFKKCMDDENVECKDIEYTDSNERESNGIISAYYKRSNSAGYVLRKRVETGDIIYSLTDILPDVLPAVKIKKRNKNVIWIPITHHIIESFIKRPGNKITNFLSEYQQKYAMHLEKRYADRYLTPSPVVEDWYIMHGYDKNRIRRSGVNVDVAKIEHIKDPNADSFDACFMARLNYSKGIMELPTIWKKVVETIPEARLIIIGKGRDDVVDKLKNAIEEQHMENSIVLGGFMDDNRAFSIMKKSKLFLFTSHEEGFGLAIAEAMLCNLPVVAYDLPVFEKVFEKGILLCEFLNTDKMADSVISLLLNDEKRIELGEEGHNYIKNKYDLDVFAKRELDILLESIR